MSTYEMNSCVSKKQIISNWICLSVGLSGRGCLISLFVAPPILKKNGGCIWDYLERWIIMRPRQMAGVSIYTSGRAV